MQEQEQVQVSHALVLLALSANLLSIALCRHVGGVRLRDRRSQLGQARRD